MRRCRAKTLELFHHTSNPRPLFCIFQPHSQPAQIYPSPFPPPIVYLDLCSLSSNAPINDQETSRFPPRHSKMAFPSMRSLGASENAGPAALMLVLALIHRSLRTRGFTLRRSIWASDTIIMMLLVFIVNIWSLLVLVSWPNAVTDAQTPSAGVIAIPWLALIFAYFWILTFASTYFLAGSTRGVDTVVGPWTMDCSNGPFGWRESVKPRYLYALYLCLAMAQIPCSMMMILRGSLPQGILSIAGMSMFLASALPHNKYILAPHRYSGDMLRIALPTSHIEGTVYVLPSSASGFEATWSPKIKSEHEQTDAEMMALFASMRTGSYSLSEPLRRLRTTMAAFNERVHFTEKELINLGEWLLMEPGSVLRTLTPRAKRPDGVHLVGRDLMYALAHAEYLVFMRKNSLPLRLRSKLSKLRQKSRSGGLDDSDSIPTIGYVDGIAGYQEAVRYVYDLFNQPMDPSALEPPPMPPHISSALGRRVTSTEDYASSLWTLCLEHSESTFSALFMFCCIWFIEVGNVGGFHIFPFQCQSHRGDATAWQILWRQGWYECLTAQMIASSPVLALGFAAGLIQ